MTWGPPLERDRVGIEVEVAAHAGPVVVGGSWEVLGLQSCRVGMEVVLGSPYGED